MVVLPSPQSILAFHFVPGEPAVVAMVNVATVALESATPTVPVKRGPGAGVIPSASKTRSSRTSNDRAAGASSPASWTGRELVEHDRSGWPNNQYECEVPFFLVHSQGVLVFTFLGKTQEPADRG